MRVIAGRAGQCSTSLYHRTNDIMARVLWKGGISFGLVHVPVSLYPATKSEGLSFDMLDKRDFGPVGYKRYNKNTGEDVAWENIIKGYEYEKGQYVVVSDEDFKQANVKATQTVDILGFVDQASIAPYFFETPYYLEPGKRGEKGYALLRDVLKRTNRVGIAQVVIRARQHLAALIPFDRLLVLNTLRYPAEIRSPAELELPETGKTAGLTDKELQMGERLVEDMAEEWKPAQYKDTYRDDLMARIEAKIKSGHTHVVTPEGETPAEQPRTGAEVIDLVALLQRSLAKKGKGAEKGAGNAAANDEPEQPRRAAARKPASRLAGAKKRKRA
jgi:DNA end-binding protein Ku